MLSRLLSLLIRLTIAALLVGGYFSTTFAQARAQTVPPAGAAASRNRAALYAAYPDAL